MAASSIEWTDRVWNPVAGCQLKSPGCTNCYAMGMARRLELMGMERYVGLTRVVNGKPVWTGEVRAVPEALLTPLSVRKPAKWFVNSMSDPWADGMLPEWLWPMFAVMALTPQHDYQVLTKRPDRMAAMLLHPDAGRQIMLAAMQLARRPGQLAGYSEEPVRLAGFAVTLPLKNVILGSSVEDQVRADERRSPMADLAAAGWPTFVSYEPALGPVDWTGWAFLRWLISGGESGHGARPSHPAWHRAARDFCAAGGIPYLFKQWGAWGLGQNPKHRLRYALDDGTFGDLPYLNRTTFMSCVGKKAAGRLLDGVEHNAFPVLAR